MDAVSSCNSSLRDGNRDMERLFEAFGASFSLEAITSAYSQARRNVDLAGAILYETQGSTLAMTHQSKDEPNAASILSPALSADDASKWAYTAKGNSTVPAEKIASGSSGGENVWSMLSENGSLRSQPSKQHLNESLAVCSKGKDDDMHEDIGEFLFKMLGDGFQLDMKMIHDVLGLCGYDLGKSMETLVELSASTLEKSDDVVIRSSEREEYQKTGSHSSSEKSQFTDYSPRSMKHNGKNHRKKNKDKHDLQREILGSLFTGPERVEEQPKRIIPRSGIRRPSAFARTVVKPLKETKIEQSFVTVKPLADDEGVKDEEYEDSFPVLRQAVKEYWAMMKEYYTAAADAYSKGDKELADKLVKEGQYYNRKAREADEKSAQNPEASDEEMLLDFSTLDPREAIRLLKLHLSNLAGISSIRYLKVTVGNDEGEREKRGGKRLVLKLLEKESIEWTEADDGKTIVLRLDEINPKILSFAKKQEVKL